MEEFKKREETIGRSGNGDQSSRKKPNYEPEKDDEFASV
jgi:hypothetical protein